MPSSDLKRRLVPKLLIKRRQIGRSIRSVLVTTRGFREEIEVGDPVSQAKIYEAQLSDELVVLNIDNQSIGSDGTSLALISRLASETFMPLVVGGGVRSLEDFSRLLGNGADKVAINTLALDDPASISMAASRFGVQCVVVSIDFRTAESGFAFVCRDRASRPLKLDVVTWAREVVARGAGELLLCDADRDGSGSGLNTGVARAVVDAVDVPVTLSGGCGLAEHFVQGFRDGGAEAVAAGTFFCFRDQSPMQTRAHILNAGIPIRTET